MLSRILDLNKVQSWLKRRRISSTSGQSTWNNVTRIHEDLKSSLSMLRSEIRSESIYDKDSCYSKIACRQSKPAKSDISIHVYICMFIGHNTAVMQQLITTDAPLPSKRGWLIEWNSFTQFELCRNSQVNYIVYIHKCKLKTKLFCRHIFICN